MLRKVELTRLMKNLKNDLKKIEKVDEKLKKLRTTPKSL